MKHAAVPLLVLMFATQSLLPQSTERPRLRELGVEIGIFQTGKHNAITDVPGVLVGHRTVIEGDNIRTGVTAILPHEGNLFREKIPAALYVGNGFGKLVGATQLEELGQIETPILLTNTLSVWDAARGAVDFMLALPGNENVRSINPIVGETNDGGLNDIRGRAVTSQHAIEAIRQAATGPVAEGCVGAGTGTVCFGWKGGIGTSSRVLPTSLGGYTVGVLVQTNFGGILDIAGVPVGKALGKFSYKNEIQNRGDGSCIIVVATNAPANSQQLKRLAKRATLALGRTGSAMSHGSGDYVIAFSTAEILRIRAADQRETPSTRLRDDDLSPLFQAAVESTEEAIDNSLLKAIDTKGFQGREVKALPVEKVVELLRKYGKIR
ncbi:MAG: aminopeptidase [Ignavibacteria bacterium GWA2_54_16]|nr:MAG: aminopeptidase [Ignavibacteria bacterium GWA2_54_16]